MENVIYFKTVIHSNHEETEGKPWRNAPSQVVVTEEINGVAVWFTHCLEDDTEIYMLSWFRTWQRMNAIEYAVGKAKDFIADIANGTFDLPRNHVVGIRG